MTDALTPEVLELAQKLSDALDRGDTAENAAEYFQSRYREARSILSDLAAYDPGGGWGDHDICIFCEEVDHRHKPTCFWARAQQMTKTRGVP